MPELNIGRTGAARQTWRDKNLRELVVEVVTAKPKGTEAQWRQDFRDMVRNDPDYLDAVCDYAFDNAIVAIRKAQERKSPSAQEQAARAEARAKEARDHAEHVGFLKEQVILLNQEMPNGKRLRFCTLDYLYRLGGKYRQIGKINSAKLVGEAYSEGEYRKKLAGLT
jgi:hypothetical protein